MKKDSITAIGLMSGTSLDGLDVVCVTFSKTGTRWNYTLHEAKTYNYDFSFQKTLQRAPELSGLELALLHNEVGTQFGKLVQRFQKNLKNKPALVASHGHTVFHQPEAGLTLQIGNASYIAALARLPVVADFRSLDVALGGQGAPLVPVADQYLFSEFKYCLNLGGIANISVKHEKGIKAFDICALNMVLNRLASRQGKAFDAGGQMAAKGLINKQLLLELNQLAYYKRKPPKSLGAEWVGRFIFPLMERYRIPVADLMRTYCEHAAMQIALCTKERGAKMLATGGGTWNTFLMERIAECCECQVIVPDKNTVNFKEAIAFAFLGVLRWRNEINCLASVTGAKRDSVGGVIQIL